MKKLDIFIFLVSYCNFVFSYSVSESACPRTVSRAKWGARDPLEITPISHPIQNVIVHHTVTGSCNTESGCSDIVKSIQEYHMTKKHFPDVGYNFLVGGDGQIYQGTGWYHKGSHTLGYNSKALGLGLIGTFNDSLPNDRQFKAVKNFLRCAEDLWLSEDYKLFGGRQVRNTDSPGAKLYEDLQNWPHFSTSIPRKIEQPIYPKI